MDCDRASALLSAHRGDANDGGELDSAVLKASARGRLSVGWLGWVTGNVRGDE